jgi:hypothetical protein
MSSGICEDEDVPIPPVSNPHWEIVLLPDEVLGTGVINGLCTENPISRHLLPSGPTSPCKVSVESSVPELAPCMDGTLRLRSNAMQWPQ